MSPNLPPNSAFGVGLTPVIYTAVDEAGNTDSCNFTVNITGKISHSGVEIMSSARRFVALKRKFSIIQIK